MKQQAGTSKRELSALKEGHSREIENLQRQLKAQQKAHAQEESSVATRHAEQVFPCLLPKFAYISDIQLSLPTSTGVSWVSLRCVQKVSTIYQGTADCDEGITGIMYSYAYRLLRRRRECSWLQWRQGWSQKRRGQMLSRHRTRCARAFNWPYSAPMHAASPCIVFECNGCTCGCAGGEAGRRGADEGGC